MARLQLALNVSDLEEAVDFYSRLLGTGPAKQHEGYANFAVADPPLKLVLIEHPGATERLNHLGVEVTEPDEVRAAAGRLAGEGLETRVEDATTCCFAVQDKVWVRDPDGADWEVYTVLADADSWGEPAATVGASDSPGSTGSAGGAPACCA